MTLTQDNIFIQVADRETLNCAFIMLWKDQEEERWDYYAKQASL